MLKLQERVLKEREPDTLDLGWPGGGLKSPGRPGAASAVVAQRFSPLGPPCVGPELGDQSDCGLKLGPEGPTELSLCDGNVAWFPGNAAGDPFPNYAAWRGGGGTLCPGDWSSCQAPRTAGIPSHERQQGQAPVRLRLPGPGGKLGGHAGV